MSKGFYNFVRSVMRPIYGVLFPARTSGAEHIPEHGAFIICANHVSNRDPFYLAVHAPQRQVHFMAKAELFRFKPLGALLKGLDAFPVDRGHNDLNAVRMAMKVLADGHGLGIFPQGTRSRDNSPTPMLGGASMIALRAGVPVIPAYIGGPFRLFRRTPMRFGPALELSDLGRRFDSDTLAEATRRIEDGIWSLKD